MLDFILYDYPVVGSTNDEVKVLLAQGAVEGTVVRAERQTTGRGRRGRRWISEPGNLYCSLLLMPKCPLIQVSQLSFVMAVAVGRAILPFLTMPETLSYKWPNDLLLQKEKVAGILIETESQGGQVAEACVVGIGLNLNSLPDHPAYPVTALQHHATAPLNRDVVFTALLDQIKAAYQTWRQEGFDPIREEWLQRAHGLGKEVGVTRGEKEIRGQFIGLTSGGALLLKDANGKVHEFMSAEIS